MSNPAPRYFIFATAAGYCGISWNANGITRFMLPVSSAEAAAINLARRVPGAVSGAPRAAVATTIDAVKRYFEGEKIEFTDVQLDLAGQDSFFVQVYAAARRIGWGQTTTYGALARQLSDAPEAAREVGQAMARNPIPLIIPCHRVLAAGGKVGGFSAPGGSATKMRMLGLEGVDLAAAPPAQRSLEL